MLGRKQEINLQVNQILDSLLIALVFWLSHSLHFWVRARFFPEFGNIPPFADFFWLMAIVVPFTPIILEAHGYYDHPLHKTVAKSFGQILRTFVILGLVIGACVVFFRWGAASRIVLVLVGVIGSGALLAKEAIVIAWLRRRVRSEGLRERVLLVGTPGDIQRFRDKLGAVELAQMQVCEEIDISLQPVEELVEALHRHSVERVLFSVGHVHFDKVQNAISACELEGVEAWLAGDFITTNIARPTFDTLGGKLMMVFRSTPEVSWQMLAKQLLDRVGACLALVFFAPIWILAWIGIRLTSPGPVMFRQERGGKHGKPFLMYKFRTMVVDAEERKAELQPLNQMSGPVFKVEADPRIFRSGRFLRKWSLDELPQFLNVLRGEMSLVGPRPLPTYEVEKIEYSSQRRRMSMSPGITCIWQISGRNEITDFEEWVRLDLQYIDNWSIWLDIKILVRTVLVVLFRRGAS